MPNYFVIKTLEEGYTWQDFLIRYMELDYATEVLEIPPERIEAVAFSPDPDKLEILLYRDDSMSWEAWYSTLVPFVAKETV